MSAYVCEPLAMNCGAISELSNASVMRSSCLHQSVSVLWLSAWVLGTGVLAQAQFDYTTNYGSITITGYSGPGGAVAIPDTINDLPVTGIGERAFFARTLTSVTQGNNLSSIGDWAFHA